MFRPTISLALIASLTIFGCSKDKNKAEGEGESGDTAAQKTDTSSLKDPPFLAYIPADSPLVLANFKPLPKEVIDKFGSMFTPFVAMANEEIPKELADKPELLAIWNELGGKLSAETLTKLGLTLETHFGVYTIGASLAMRIGLADGAKLRAFAEKVAAAHKLELKEEKLGDAAYWKFADEDKEVALIVAITDKEAVLGVMHPATVEEILPILLLQNKPEKSVADTKELRNVVGSYGFAGIFSGYVDTKKIAAIVLGKGSALSKSTLAKSGATLPEFSPECVSEIEAVAAVAPRAVMGYREVSATKLTTLFALELAGTHAKDLKALTAPLPPLNADKAMFAMALGADFNKSVEWMRKRGSAIAAAPYKCEHLSFLNEAGSELAEMKNPLPPAMGNIHGGLVVVNKVDASQMPPSGEGYVLMGLEKPKALIDMVSKQAGMPLDIKEGKATSLPVPLPIPGGIHGTYKGQWLGIGIGIGEKKVEELVAANKADASRFMEMRYDYAKFADLMKKFTAMGGPETAMLDLYKGMGVMDVRMSFTDRGIEMTSVQYF